TSFGASSVTVTNLNTSSAVTTSPSYSGNTKTVTFTFPGGILASANYRTVLNGATITDAAGNAVAGSPSGNFFFQVGECNHDRAANALDFNALASNFGQSGKTFAQGNFNYDAIVNSLDFNALAAAFGNVLAPSPAAPIANDAPAASAVASLFSRDRIHGAD